MPPKRGRCTDKSYKQVVSRVLLTTTVLRLGWQQDVWLEAVRLQTPENAKAVLARGVQEIPTSVKLWMQVNRLRKP
jgi:pre-mRNA-processing factor 6